MLSHHKERKEGFVGFISILFPGKFQETKEMRVRYLQCEIVMLLSIFFEFVYVCTCLFSSALASSSNILPLVTKTLRKKKNMDYYFVLGKFKQ